MAHGHRFFGGQQMATGWLTGTGASAAKGGTRSVQKGMLLIPLAALRIGDHHQSRSSPERTVNRFPEVVGIQSREAFIQDDEIGAL